MSFFVQIRTYLAFFILFGLWSSWRNTKYKFLLKIYSVLSIISGFAIYSLAVLIDGFSEFNALPNIVSNILYILQFLTHFITALESILKTGAQAKLIDTLSTVDYMFYTKIGIAIPYRTEKCQILLRTMILLFIEIIIKLAIVVVLIFLNVDKRFSSLALVLYSNFFIYLRVIQIIFFMSLLRNRLIMLNNELIDIVNSTTNRSCTRRVSAKRSMYDRLINLKQIYSKLYDTCEQIDETFGWSLLLLVIFIFATVTIEYYWAYISLGDTRTVLICLFYSVPVSITLSTLAYYCSSCFQQVCVSFCKIS